MSSKRRRRSLAGRIAALVALLVAATVALTLALARWLPEETLLVASTALLLALPLSVWAIRRALRPMLSLFRALAGSVISYRDGDFSFGLNWPRADELGDLVAAHNA